MGFGVASPWMADFTAATNARSRPTCCTSKTSRGSSVSCSMRRPTPIRRGAPGTRPHPLGAEPQRRTVMRRHLPEAMAAAWAGRLELWPASPSAGCSGAFRGAGLRLFRTRRDPLVLVVLPQLPTSRVPSVYRWPIVPARGADAVRRSDPPPRGDAASQQQAIPIRHTDRAAAPRSSPRARVLRSGCYARNSSAAY